MNTQVKGKEGEDKACKYLEIKGFRILNRNYRSRHGEIDIVAQKDKCLVFTEVKSWKGIPYEESGFSINKRKQGRIINTAKQYLFENEKIVSGLDVRFDFIFINAVENNPNGELIHNENVIEEFY